MKRSRRQAESLEVLQAHGQECSNAQGAKPRAKECSRRQAESLEVLKAHDQECSNAQGLAPWAFFSSRLCNARTVAVQLPPSYRER